ncbi:UNVERIFIED_CONTAM: hypothetical protein RMT77_018498 [Armadillidium vulgare]
MNLLQPKNVFFNSWSNIEYRSEVKLFILSCSVLNPFSTNLSIALTHSFSFKSSMGVSDEQSLEGLYKSFQNETSSAGTFYLKDALKLYSSSLFRCEDLKRNQPHSLFYGLRGS